MEKYITIFAIYMMVLSCKKEPTEIRITWQDSQKVRILKVEQTVSPNSFPFDTDDLMTVEYTYTDRILKEIIVHRSGETHIYPLTASESCRYEINLSKDIKYGGILVWINSLLNTSGGKISSNQKRYGDGFGWGAKFFKDSYYTYGTNGLLGSIKVTSIWSDGSDSVSILKETELETKSYSNALLKTYSLKNYLLEYDPATELDQLAGQDFTTKATYQTAAGVPDGLIRLVNQAVLGLNRMGFEDYYLHSQYDIRTESDLIEEDKKAAHAADVAKYRYTFADWIFSFGLNNAFVIPNQGNQLIATKHITGKTLVDGEYEYDEDDHRDRLINPVYLDIDSIANYLYIHNSIDKILEIAGLKIHYELVE